MTAFARVSPNGRSICALLDSAIDPALCPGTDASASPDGYIHFRKERIAATGQSLGAIQLHNWVASDSRLGAFAATGIGGHIALMGDVSAEQFHALITFLRETLQIPVDEPLDPLAPITLVFQLAIETMDPVAHASRLIHNPLAGVAAKHWYTPAGYMDSLFSPNTIRALVGAMGAELAGTPVHDSLVDLADRRDLHAPDYPVTANVDSPDGPRTAVVVQYEAADYDGHLVVLNEPGAQHQIMCFLETYLATGTPTVPAPGSPGDACPQ